MVAGKGTMRPAIVHVEGTRWTITNIFDTFVSHTNGQQKQVDEFVLLSPLPCSEWKNDLVEYGHHMKYPPGSSADKKVLQYHSYIYFQ